jgi:DNA-binding MarR family transcriptional regulator
MTTSQVLRTLEAKGLLERLDDPADARAKRVSLTAAGRELLTVAVPAVEETDAEFFAAVSRPQALTLLTSLLKEAKRT